MTDLCSRLGLEVRHKGIGKHVVEQEYRNHGNAGKEHPPVTLEDIVFLQATKHVPPTRHRLTHTKPEEREGYFGKDELRYQQGRLSQHDGGSFREEMAPENVSARRAEPAGSANKITLFRAQNNSSNQTRGPRPSCKPDHA